MASTIQLQATSNWASTFVRNYPLTGINGVMNEPTLTIGNTVLQFILAPPFAWRWNRGTATFTTTAGTQDYSESLPDFGWLEKASFGNSGTSENQELLVELNLAKDKLQNPPVRIASFLDDDTGDITFRLLPVPDATYTVYVDYQMRSPTMGTLNATWAPIPDYLQFMYNMGFLAYTYEYAEDERFPFAYQRFVRQVIATNAGLADSQVNIYLADRINTTRDSQAQIGNSNLGRAGRSASQQ